MSTGCGSKEISKYLSYILRHKPDAIGLELDPEGWAEIDGLIAKAEITLDHDMLREIVATSDKQRFAISADGLFIRANQGHSIAVDLGLTPVKPPEFLFHGTSTRFLQSIREHGIRPQNRQYVHLSSDREAAAKVGQRHGKPIVLEIAALASERQGHEFFKAQNGVWLTKAIAPDAILDLNPTARA
ncbi:MAG: RNA--NAD 2'-phosphotransferase [Citromicrobium sp.]|nr:MAG: RNA--NAD 2'-phosphotransferase [Citromicrobium sp.]